MTMAASGRLFFECILYIYTWNIARGRGLFYINPDPTPIQSRIVDPNHVM